jgi:hypothetical protein
MAGFGVVRLGKAGHGWVWPGAARRGVDGFGEVRPG